VAVDAFESAGREDHAYSTIGKLLAEVIEADPGNVLAAYSTQTGKMVYMHPNLANNLRGPAPLEALGFPNPPVVQITSGDSEMKAAAQEALRRWPEFVQAFAARTPSDAFSAKVGMVSGIHREFIWLTPTSITDTEIHGRLANEPANLRGRKINDAVTVSINDLNDWLYKNQAGTHGGFTVKVLMKRQGK
jgi:uncharacterized protein YegJ (DUF2314 family)